jgi:hypothetical protein
MIFPFVRMDDLTRGNDSDGDQQVNPGDANNLLIYK